MKNMFECIFLTAVAALVVASCSKPELEAPAGLETGSYTYVFNLASTETKALIGDDSIEYESTDGLGVFVGDVVNSPSGVNMDTYPVSVTVTASKALAAGDKLYAYYPYSAENASASASEVRLEIPAEQTQSGVNYDADAMPMVSVPFTVQSDLAINTKEPVGQLYMKNLGSVVEFNIFGADFTSEKIRSVRFVSQTRIAGSFTFDLTSVADAGDMVHPALGLSAARTSLDGSLSVGADGLSAAKVYMVVAPGEHKGTVEVYTDGAMYVFNMESAVAFNRSKVRPLNLDLAKAQRNVYGVLELVSNSGYNPDDYIQLEMDYTNYAYYHSANAKYLSSLCTDASNCVRFVASQLFTKDQIPNGSLIVCGEGYQYRPEGWVDLDTKNNTEGGAFPARPANVTENVVEVNDEWWSDWAYRGFNLSYIANTNLTDDTALAMQQNFAVFVPRADSSSASLEDILDAAGYDVQEYTKVDLQYVKYAYYNSNSSLDQLVTTANNSAQFVATKIFSKSDLPEGSVIVMRSGYQYRPEAWTALDVETQTRPAKETAGVVEVNNTWWADWNYRAFNLQLASGAALTDETAEDLMESFGVFVPKNSVPASADLTALIKSAGYNPDDYVQLKVDYTDFAYYQSNTDYISTLRTVGIDGWNGTISDFVATPIYAKADLPDGTLLVQVADHHYRPEGWVDLNTKNASRPADVSASVVEVDDVWWGSYNYRGFNLSLYEGTSRQDLAASADATETRCQELHDGFGILVPRKALTQNDDEDQTEEGNSIKILAIGNSFSQDATEYLYGMLKDLGYDNIVIGNIYKVHFVYVL